MVGRVQQRDLLRRAEHLRLVARMRRIRASRAEGAMDDRHWTAAPHSTRSRRLLREDVQTARLEQLPLAEIQQSPSPRTLILRGVVGGGRRLLFRSLMGGRRLRG